MTETFACNACNATIERPPESIGTGYATDKDGNKICYSCCGKEDAEYMRVNGKNTLYLTSNGETSGHVSNWPGTLKIPCHIKRGRHNIARYRYDVWFKFEGRTWHGVQYGDNTQIVHCKRTK